MSGDSYHFGDVVNMHDGQGNTGIDKRTVAPADSPSASPALAEAVQELTQLLRELRGSVSPASGQAIDDSLADISADDSAPPQERHRALMAIAGIAATVGTVGQPVLDAVNRILVLLGAR